MVRRSVLLLATWAAASILTGCTSNRLGTLANNLRNAEVGAPVVVTQQEGSIIVTSSADYMFPSGGWQIPSDSPVLNKMAPILAQLRNTKIVIGGYTDNTPVGPQLQRMGIANNQDLSSRRANSVLNYLVSQGVCVKKVCKHHAVREMKVDTSEPPCRGRPQTTISCFGRKAVVVNVMEKA